ncbi:hypothetical protein JL720_10954 [Aureococcus anophagefferens]|nr:hypothetical protein JL720_10954 [Aureococcus anophagefferens]
MSDPDRETLHNIDQERAALRARLARVAAQLAQRDEEAAALRRRAEEADAPRRTRSPVKAGRQKRGPPAEADVIDVDAESSAPEPPAAPAEDDAPPADEEAEWEDAAPEEAFSVCAEASSVRAPDDEAQWDEPAAPPASDASSVCAEASSRARRRGAVGRTRAPPAPDDEARWDEPAAPPAPDDEAQWDEPAAPPAPDDDGRSAFDDDTVNGEVEPRTPPAFDPRKLVVVDERGGRRCDLEDFEEGAGFLVSTRHLERRRAFAGAVYRVKAGAAGAWRCCVAYDDSTIERDVKWPRVTWDDGADAAAHAPEGSRTRRAASPEPVLSSSSESESEEDDDAVGDAESESDSDSSDDDAEEGQAERDGSEEEPSPPDDAPADAVAAAAAVAADPALRGRVLLADDADDDDDDFVEARPSGRDRGTFYGAAPPPRRRLGRPDDEGRAPEPAAPPSDEDEFAFDVDDDDEVDVDDEDAAVGEEEDTDRAGRAARSASSCSATAATRRTTWAASASTRRPRATGPASAAPPPRARAGGSGAAGRTTAAPTRRAVQAAARQQDQLRRVMRGAGGTAREAMRREKERQTEVGYHAASDTWPGFDSDDDDDDDAPLVVLREGDARVALDSGRAWLKPHQRSCLKFVAQNVLVSLAALRRGDAGHGCVVAHAMGLGKTFVVVALCCLLLNDDTLRAAAAAGGRRLDRVLVVAPASTLDNWAREIDLWSRRLLNNDGVADRVFHLFRLAKSVDERRRVARVGAAACPVELRALRTLVVGGQKRHRGFFTTYVAEAADVVVCDEAHRVKREKARLATALAAVGTARRVGLTGTPVQNNLGEFYAMLSWARPLLLDERKAFDARFAEPIAAGLFDDSSKRDVTRSKRRMAVLHTLLEPVVHRRGAALLASALPPKHEVVVYCRLTDVQRRLYGERLAIWERGGDDKSGGVFALCEHLRQVFNHPHVAALARRHNEERVLPAKLEKRVMASFICDDDEESDAGSGADEVADLRGPAAAPRAPREAADVLCAASRAGAGEKVLVFSQSLRSLDYLQISVVSGDLGWPARLARRLDGDTTVTARQALIEDFSSSDAVVFFLSVRAAGVGINLHAATRVILFDVSWNPADDAQAIARAHRFGQERPVFVYRLVAAGTVEERVFNRQIAKGAVASGVADDEVLQRFFRRDELADLIPLVEEDDDDGTRDKPLARTLDRLFLEVAAERAASIARVRPFDTFTATDDDRIDDADVAAALDSLERSGELDEADEPPPVAPPPLPVAPPPMPFVPPGAAYFVPPGAAYFPPGAVIDGRRDCVRSRDAGARAAVAAQAPRDAEEADDKDTPAVEVAAAAAPAAPGVRRAGAAGRRAGARRRRDPALANWQRYGRGRAAEPPPSQRKRPRDAEESDEDAPPVENHVSL